MTRTVHFGVAVAEWFEGLFDRINGRVTPASQRCQIACLHGFDIYKSPDFVNVHYLELVADIKRYMKTGGASFVDWDGEVLTFQDVSGEIPTKTKGKRWTKPLQLAFGEQDKRFSGMKTVNGHKCAYYTWLKENTSHNKRQEGDMKTHDPKEAVYRIPLSRRANGAFEAAEAHRKGKAAKNREWGRKDAAGDVEMHETGTKADSESEKASEESEDEEEEKSAEEEEVEEEGQAMKRRAREIG
jgi:hypothetical protein